MIRGLLFGPSLGSIVQHYWDVMELSCIKSWGRFIPPFSSCKGWEAFQTPLGTFGSFLVICPKHIATAGGGPFASLHDGNKTTTVVHMHHCMMAIRWQHMCAMLYVQYLTHLPSMENPYSLELIWYFLWFYYHCKMTLLGPVAQGAYERSVHLTWPPYGLYIWNLCSEGGHYTALHYLRGDTTLHYIISHWGCSLLEAATMAASTTRSRMLRTSFSSSFLLFCCFLLWHLLSI